MVSKKPIAEATAAGEERINKMLAGAK